MQNAMASRVLPLSTPHITRIKWCDYFPYPNIRPTIYRTLLYGDITTSWPFPCWKLFKEYNCWLGALRVCGNCGRCMYHLGVCWNCGRCMYIILVFVGTVVGACIILVFVGTVVGACVILGVRVNCGRCMYIILVFVGTVVGACIILVFVGTVVGACISSWCLWELWSVHVSSWCLRELWSVHVSFWCLWELRWVRVSYWWCKQNKSCKEGRFSSGQLSRLHGHRGWCQSGLRQLEFKNLSKFNKYCAKRSKWKAVSQLFEYSTSCNHTLYRSIKNCYNYCTIM